MKLLLIALVLAAFVATARAQGLGEECSTGIVRWKHTACLPGCAPPYPYPRPVLDCNPGLGCCAESPYRVKEERFKGPYRVKEERFKGPYRVKEERFKRPFRVREERF